MEVLERGRELRVDTKTGLKSMVDSGDCKWCLKAEAQ